MKTTKKALSVLLAVLLLAGCLSAAFSVYAVTVISSVNLTCPIPEVGGAFPTVADASCTTSPYVCIESITVKEVQGSSSVDATAPFKAGKTYKIYFNLRIDNSAISQYGFPTDLTAKVNGESCTVFGVINPTKASVIWTVKAYVSSGDFDSGYGHIYWDYRSSNKTLYVYGWGSIPNYDRGKTSPWYSVCDSDKCETIVIEIGIETIGKHAFSYLTDVNSVTIPETVESIGESAFSACYDLKNITIPEGVKSIGKSAFYFSNLETVAIPKTMETIGVEAFYNCEHLRTVYYGGSRSDWNTIDIDESAFLYSWLDEDDDSVESPIPFTIVYHEFQVSLTASPAEGGAATGSGTYVVGETITVKAFADEGYHFVGWFNGSSKVSDNAQYSFTVTDDVTLTAKFEKGTAPDNPGGGNNQPTTQQQSGGCKYCGGTHTGFPGVLIGFFHSILALFGLHK